MKKTYLKQLFAALLLLCSTVASANNPVVPADETYTLTYVVDGETYQTTTLAAGAAINLPAGPAKEGYKFVKWNLETAVPLDIASNADAMLYTNAPCTDTRYGDQFTSWQVLFDGNAGTFFHSEYANNESADGLDHYLRVDMGEGKSIMNFTFTYTNRNTNSYINAPKTMVVEGSNEADGEYVELVTLTNLSSTDSDVYNSQVIGNGTAYRYIRYRVTETHYNQKVYEHPFFFIAEFGMADTAIPTTMPAADISLVAVYKELFGSCGDNATWSLNDGVLTIGGTGAMTDYNTHGDNAAPWYEYREDITTVVIEDGVTSIGSGAFSGCSGLTSVTIPGSVTSIESEAFRECSALTSITIPNSVTSIGDAAFYGCSDLTSITIPNSVTSIGSSAFYGCSDLTSVTIGNSVTTIGDCAFQYCNALTNVTIPNSVTTIGGAAFMSCALTSITIPNSVTEIGWWAFRACNYLTDIYFASNPTIDDSEIPSTTTCHLTLTDSDAADFNIANANTYADASYTRTISEGKYGTIMLPFAPDEASLQNYAFYTLKEAGDGYIRFEEVAAPVANTPYLYTLRAGGENAAITGGQTTIAADINNCNVNGWDLVGSFTNQTIDCTGGNYYAYSAARNEINRITKTLTVRPYRAYLKSTAAQNSNLRVFIGGTTGVTEISPDDIEGFDNGAVYDLYGRPVSEPAKGDIYIIDGKKVVW